MSELRLPPSARDTKWVDGLRGIAAFFVVTSHLAIAFADWLDRPSRTADIRPAFYNLPFIRVFAQGSPWVVTFLVLTGFVNALKPIKQARAGHVDSALSGLASSSFRRSARLVLPCTIATCFSWIICEFGGYNIGSKVASMWMRDTSPAPSGSVFTAIWSLFSNICTTWSRGKNTLDKNQWPMIFFLKGSFLLYVLLLATVRATARYRMLIFSAMIVYSWQRKDTHAGLPIYTGALLAEASMIPRIIEFSTNRRVAYRLLPFFLAVLAWYLMSYPINKPEWQCWSNALWKLGKTIFPEGAECQSFWHIVSVVILTLAIVLSSKLQQIFSHPILLWLGAHSFPIYLIHGPLLRSFLNWVLFAFTIPTVRQDKDDEGKVTKEYERYPIPSAAKLFIHLPLFFVVLFALAHLWLQKIEPRCAFVTKWLEETMCGVKEEPLCISPKRDDNGEKDEQRNRSVEFGERSRSVESRALLPV